MDAGVTAAPAAVPFAQALRFWLKLGFVSFGGPAGQIAIMHRELVERGRWISEGRFLHALNYCMVLPGPEAQQLATYIGWLLHGVRGGIAAGALFVLPSLGILIALSWAYMAYGHLPVVAAVLWGVKPAVVAIVLAAAWRIGSRTLRHPALVAIAVAALAALAVAHVPFPLVILGAAIAGAVGGHIAPAVFAARGHAAASRAPHPPAVIDDDTPPPPHARYRRGRLLAMAAAFGAIGLGAYGAIAALHGAASDYAAMARFFTQAALLTFGGAYAVLPYVMEGAVETYGWATAPQMIDGLALGETTPGPLIMIVAFVGFVGGWTKALLGPEALLAAGAAGAVVATFFTFLPSFLFILAGGPMVEATRGLTRFTAPLTAVTAAVVGVIVNLALVFGWHVLWPRASAEAPFSGGFDAPALAIVVAATYALVTRGIGIIPVIAAAAVAGVVSRIALS